MVMTGNTTYFVTSFDSFQNNLLFSRGTGAANISRIDGSNATANIQGLAASNSAGQFSAVDYDSTGAVIAYYDQQNDTIRLAYATGGATPNMNNNWTRRYVLDNNHALFRGSGTYVSMKVDKDNRIHLAFRNSTYNTVVYAVGTRAGTFTAYTVDNVVKGGNWTDISVDDNGNPTIVYADSARTGNYDGIRMAYKSSGTAAFTRVLRCPVTNELITGWEALTVPAEYQVNDDRLNVEVWPPTNRNGGALSAAPGWNAAVGYASRKVAGLDNGMFRLAYFYNPVWKEAGL
jgi:hypothetical protein